MKLIKRILIGLVVLIVIVVAVAFVLPRNVSVARSITIDAAPETIFPFLNDFRKFNEWSPWYGRDPDMVVEYEGAASGVGAVMTWDSAHPQVSAGRQEITASEEFSRVETSLDFGDMGTAVAHYALAPAGSGTAVTWGFTTDLGYNPIGRYMGLMFDRWIGADYEAGLAKLKTVAEAVPPPDADDLTAGPATEGETAQ